MLNNSLHLILQRLNVILYLLELLIVLRFNKVFRERRLRLIEPFHHARTRLNLPSLRLRLPDGERHVVGGEETREGLGLD